MVPLSSFEPDPAPHHLAARVDHFINLTQRGK